MKKWILLIAFGVVAISIAVFIESMTYVALPTEKEPVQLYANELRDDLTKMFVKAIEEAEESVTLIIYSLTDPNIIHALKKKSEEGCRVLVIYDKKNSPHLKKRLGKAKTLVRTPGGLSHQKILVVDQKKIWVGTANMTTASLRYYGNLVLGLYLPDLAARVDRTLRAMNKFHQDPDPEPIPFKIEAMSGTFQFLPSEKKSAEILSLISSAEKTARVAMFTFTRKDFAEALVKAKERGVDVEVAIDHQTLYGASRYVRKILINNQMPLFTNRGPGLLHYKCMVADGDTLVIGSANWTKAAFQRNDDCFLILKNLSPEISRKLNRLWIAILANGKEVHR